MADIITCLEESTTTPVYGFDHRLWNAHGRHVVEGDRAEDCCGQGESPGSVQQGGTPPRKVLIAVRNQGETISNNDFVWGQGKAKVGLRESGDRRPESSSKLLSSIIRHTDGKEGGFVVVDR